jgi:hypothetical protein
LIGLIGNSVKLISEVPLEIFSLEPLHDGINKVIMKIKKFLISTFLTASFCSLANADCGLSIQTVPFQLVIPKGCTVTSNYVFGSHNVLFCFNTQNPSIPALIVWPYRGSTQHGILPMQLKTNSSYEGYFADNRGTLKVTNNQGGNLTYSCQFAL